MNILSQTPMKTGWSYQEDDASIANLLPLAITEFNGSKFHFLLANDNFCSIFHAFATSGG